MKRLLLGATLAFGLFSTGCGSGGPTILFQMPFQFLQPVDSPGP